MSRKMPPGWIDLSRRKDKQIVSHSTLKITIDTAKLVRTYYFATSELQLDNVTWLPLLKRGDQIRASLTRAADQGVAELFNADSLLGIEFLALGQSIYGAEMKIGRYKTDLVSGFVGHKVFLTGPIVGFQVTQDVVRLSAVSEAYANISVGASRQVSPNCQWIYKDGSTCQSTSTHAECNLLLNHADGCVNRHAAGENDAKFGGMVFLNSQNRLTTS
jgi:hypothetical protein